MLNFIRTNHFGYLNRPINSEDLKDDLKDDLYFSRSKRDHCKTEIDFDEL